MLTQTLSIPWGSESLPLALPENWRIAGILEPKSLPVVADPAAEVLRALNEPVGMPPLREIARADAKIVIVIDDSSRPTPIAKILPVILDELARCGIDRQAVILVPATGLHRLMEPAEFDARTGISGLRWEHHDCDDPEKMVFLGQTSRGTPVWVNKTVAQADLVISIGCIEPHIIASFGGGFKNIVPGVAGRDTVGHNHKLNCTPATFNMVGQPVDRNGMRLDLEEAAGKVLAQAHQPRLFIVNPILNHCQEVVRVVAGDPVAAHRKGAEVSAAMCGVKVPRPADVVITSSNPMDTDLRQGVKALANTIRAVKRGGVMITLVRAQEGLGVFGLSGQKLPLGPGGMRALAPLLVRLVPQLKIKGIGEEDRFFLYFALQAMMHAKLLLYAPTVPVEARKGLPFIQFGDTLDATLQIARDCFPGSAEVLIFPHGGITYPELG